jgi:hypothetical protein
MRRYILIWAALLCGIFGLPQKDAFAATVTIYNVSFSGGQPYSGIIMGISSNTQAVSFDLNSDIGELQGFSVAGFFTVSLPAVYNKYVVHDTIEYRAAFIAEEYFAGGFNALGSPNDVEAAAQYAIWKLLAPPSFVSGVSWASLATTMLDQAQAAVNAGYKNCYWFILENETQMGFIARANALVIPGDFYLDGDVDGSDLSVLIANMSLIDLTTFAQNFGESDCQ